jgi:hypothetical protein
MWDSECVEFYSPHTPSWRDASANVHRIPLCGDRHFTLLSYSEYSILGLNLIFIICFLTNIFCGYLPALQANPLVCLSVTSEKSSPASEKCYFSFIISFYFPTHHASRPSGYRFWFIFGRSWVKISGRRPTILTDIRYFPQPLQTNGTVP